MKRTPEEKERRLKEIAAAVEKKFPDVDRLGNQILDAAHQWFLEGVHPTQILAAMALALTNWMDYASEKGAFKQSPYLELRKVLELCMADLTLRVIKIPKDWKPPAA